MKLALGMLAFLLAVSHAVGQSCVPVVSCEDVPVGTPCATPSPTLTWTNPGTPPDDGSGRRVYWRYQGATTWQRTDTIDLPCWLMENPIYWPRSIYDIRLCPQDVLPHWPIWRLVPSYAALRELEFTVTNYRVNPDGTESESTYSNTVTICVPSLCPVDEPERSQAIARRLDSAHPTYTCDY